MEVFNSDRGRYNLNCGSKLLREPKNFKTKEFTWATEVNNFHCNAIFIQGLKNVPQIWFNNCVYFQLTPVTFEDPLMPNI
jgi:hypothetical protein